MDLAPEPTGLRTARRAPRSVGRIVVFAVLAGLVASLLWGLAPVLGATPGAVAGAEPGLVVTNLGLNLAGPQGIATGSDGNLWVANQQGASILRSTPAGDFTVFPTGDLEPSEIVAGPDGSLWFTTDRPVIGRITTSGALTTFPVPEGTGSIVSGPEGALWFTRNTGLTHELGRMTMAGAITLFPLGQTLAAQVLVTGADGNLWFTTEIDFPFNRVGRMTPAGVVTSVALPSGVVAADLASSAGGDLWFTTGEQTIGQLSLAGEVTMYTAAFMGHTGQITAGADGNMWFSNSQGFSVIGRITPTGAINVSYAKPDKLVDLPGMIAGPDGNVWFTTDKGSIGRITPAGAMVLFKGTWVHAPTSITVGPDGALWFGNVGNGTLGRVASDGGISHVQPAGITTPTSLTAGPDGNLWFVNGLNILRMTMGGVVTSMGSPFYRARTITNGPDGNLWFTYDWDYGKRGAARLTPQGTITGFQDDARDARQIITGPDGNLWYTSLDGIYRITPAGASTWFFGKGDPIPGSPTRLAFGGDGNVWFVTEQGALVRMTTDGTTTLMSPSGTVSAAAIATDPDGSLWVATASGNALVRFATTGQKTTVEDPTIRGVTSIVKGPDGAMWFTNAGNNSIGRVGSVPVPGEPTGVSAVAGKQRATVSWSPPAAGVAPVTATTVTASPGGASCTWTVGPPSCVVSGLSAGTSYTFTAVAANGAGPGPASTPSNAVVPWDGAGYHPVTPARILDSRTAIGAWPGPLASGAPRDLQVTGLGGGSDVPASASAVVMNVTATGGTQNSFVTAWPSGTGPPTASNLNFAVGQTIPNLVTVKLGMGGKVSFRNAAGAVDLVADVVGYYDDGEGPGALFNGITPVRLLDSRAANGGWNAPLVAGSPRDLVVRQPERAGGVPASATAVVANVTVTEGTADSFVSVWPSGLPQPGVSNLNFAAGQTVPNLAVVKIGDGGAIRFANAVGSAHLVVDVVGYFDATAGARFHAITPTRVLDDRVGTGLSGPWGPGDARALPVAGAAGSNVPATATDLVANVTATGATAGTFVTAFPHGIDRPTSSNLNVGVGQTIPNLVTVKVGTLGSVDLFNAAGSVDLIADVVGYYAPT